MNIIDDSSPVTLIKNNAVQMFSNDQLSKINSINGSILLPSLNKFDTTIKPEIFKSTGINGISYFTNPNDRLKIIDNFFNTIYQVKKKNNSPGIINIDFIDFNDKDNPNEYYISNVTTGSGNVKEYYIFRIILEDQTTFVKRKQKIIDALITNLNIKNLNNKRQIEYIKQTPFPTDVDNDANEDNYNQTKAVGLRIILIFKLSGTSLFLKYKEFYELADNNNYYTISRSNQHPGITVYPDQSKTGQTERQNPLYTEAEDEEAEEEAEEFYGFNEEAEEFNGFNGGKRRTKKRKQPKRRKTHKKHFSKKCHKTLRRKYKKTLRRKYKKTL